MKIIIIGAMDVEIEKIIETYNMTKEVNTNREIYLSKYKDKELIVSKSGVGKVNSAINTQYIIDKYNPDYIVNVGIAGSIDKNIKIFDTIISTSVKYHDFPLINWIPGNNNIKSSDVLINKTIESIKHLYLNYHLGIFATGDSFVTNNETRDKISKETGAIAVDMESASIGHTCEVNNIPFIIIRNISDFADGNDYFETEAAYKTIEIIKCLIDKL